MFQQRLVSPPALTAPSVSCQPNRVTPPREVIEVLPSLREAVSQLDSDLTKVSVQSELKALLFGNKNWADWIATLPSPVSLKPIVLERGLGFERDDEFARTLLVGLALSLQPENFVPPYSVGNLAVTEVIAKGTATEASHSENDLPAPPHCAGFFEPVPPQVCFFTCIRPHPGGGAETTVVNLERILELAPQALIEEWENREYQLRTSRRLGEQVLPFRLLQNVNGLPFLRYRKEYTVDFEQTRALCLLEELITHPANHFIVPLKAGDTLIHWNGSPHSRMAQSGSTPVEIEARRKLIRCRSVPQTGWAENFHQ